MRKIQWLVILTLVVLVTACSHRENSAKKNAVTGKQVTKVVQHALATMQSYMEQQKQEYQDKAAAQLERIGRRIDKLQAKAEKLDKDLKAKLIHEIEALKAQKEAAGVKLEKMKGETEQGWEALKSGVDAALEDLEKEYDNVVDKLG